MLTAIFFYLFWACVLAGAVFVGFFMWLNSRDSRIDDRQYDPQFDPGKAVEINAFRGVTPDDKIDPAKALRAYAQPIPRMSTAAREAATVHGGEDHSQDHETQPVERPERQTTDAEREELAAEKNESGIE